MNSVAEMTSRAREVGDPKAAFLKAIAETGNFTVSSRYAGIQRNTAYRWIEKDPEFRKKYEEALDVSIDLLEYAGRDRAIKGVKKDIYYKGEVVGEQYEPSDRLLELYLKAHREKFRDKQQIDLNASFTVEVAAFAALGAELPAIDGQVVESIADDSAAPSSLACDASRVGVDEGGTPKTARSAVDDSIDIADFSEIFSEK